MKVYTKQDIINKINLFRELLGLSDIAINVEFYQDEDADTMAETNQKSGVQIASIRYNIDHLETDEDTLNRILIHELLHVHMFQLFHYVTDAMSLVCSSREYSAFYNGFLQHEELVVDRIALALSKKLIPYFTESPFGAMVYEDPASAPSPHNEKDPDENQPA